MNKQLIKKGIIAALDETAEETSNLRDLVKTLHAMCGNTKAAQKAIISHLVNAVLHFQETLDTARTEEYFRSARVVSAHVKDDSFFEKQNENLLLLVEYHVRYLFMTEWEKNDDPPFYEWSHQDKMQQAQ